MKLTDTRMTWPLEASIMIGDTFLTIAQSLAIRMAVTDKLTHLRDQTYRAALGEEMAVGYEARLREVEAMLSPAARACGHQGPTLGCDTCCPGCGHRCRLNSR